MLVARFAGANDPEKVNRVVYQAFLTAFGLSVDAGRDRLCRGAGAARLVNAAPEVQAEALPFLRAMFIGIFGMMHVLHAERRVPRCRRSADAASARRDR